MASPGLVKARTVTPSRPSMPSPMTMLSRVTPSRSASFSRRSKCSGSQYQLTRSSSAAMAALATGEMPKALSLAPIR